MFYVIVGLNYIRRRIKKIKLNLCEEECFIFNQYILSFESNKKKTTRNFQFDFFPNPIVLALCIDDLLI